MSLHAVTYTYETGRQRTRMLTSAPDMAAARKLTAEVREAGGLLSYVDLKRIADGRFWKDGVDA